LWPGRSFHWSWRRGDEPAGEIEVVSTNDAVVLVFCWRASDSEKWTAFEQRVPLTRTTCHFGGARPWFLCPEEIEGGQFCGRRVAKLYLRGHEFACRQCGRLGYESQSENPIDRSIRRARKIRGAVGGGPSILDLFPDKPPNMRWRSYGRLFNQAEAEQERRIALSHDHLRRRNPGWKPVERRISAQLHRLRLRILHHLYDEEIQRHANR
jgi:hypothetical protein